MFNLILAIASAAIAYLALRDSTRVRKLVNNQCQHLMYTKAHPIQASIIRFTGASIRFILVFASFLFIHDAWTYLLAFFEVIS